MKSIKENVTNEIIIKKSKFITKLYKVYNLEEIENILFELKKEYKDATHICYAYILNNIKRFNDDNEPSKTAGIPILKVLENNELDNVLCVVIRYFGGIKLGASGLIRAYCNCTCEALNKTSIIELVPAKIIELSFCYDKLKKIDSIVKDLSIIEKNFNQIISYTIIIKNDEFNSLKNSLNNLYQSLEIKQDTFTEI